MKREIHQPARAEWSRITGKHPVISLLESQLKRQTT